LRFVDRAALSEGTDPAAMNFHASLAETSARPHLLMCPPRHFAVTYSINPWMDPQAWAGDGHLHAEAQRQWAALREALIAAGAAAGPVLEGQFGRPCLPLPLNDACFYHLDTALCALPCGAVMYYPGAFTPAARATIEDNVAAADRIALDRADAERFAANAVCIGNTIVLSSCSAGLRARLQEPG